LKRHLLDLSSRGLGRLASALLGLGLGLLLGLSAARIPGLADLLGNLCPKRLELAPQVTGLRRHPAVSLLAQAALGLRLRLLRGCGPGLGVLNLGQRLLQRLAGARVGGNLCRGGLPLHGLRTRLELALEPLALGGNTVLHLRLDRAGLVFARGALLHQLSPFLGSGSRPLQVGDRVSGLLGLALGGGRSFLRAGEPSLQLVELRSGLDLGPLQVLLQGEDLIDRALLGGVGRIRRGHADALGGVAASPWRLGRRFPGLGGGRPLSRRLIGLGGGGLLRGLGIRGLGLGALNAGGRFPLIPRGHLPLSGRWQLGRFGAGAGLRFRLGLSCGPPLFPVGGLGL
jgi:hypothetical protein